MKNFDEVLKNLKLLSDPKNLEGMSKFGIDVKSALGVPLPKLRKLAKDIGANHKLALQLWDSNIHEAQILASMIDDPNQVTEKQMEKWVKDFYSWDQCDQVCSNLFDKTCLAYDKAKEWSKRNEEFEKRAGFVLMATLAVHDKRAGDRNFIQFLPLIKKESIDDRNYVKKAVNWALRQIGKRNLLLNERAIDIAEKIQKIDSKSAKWIASDAIRELKNKELIKRLYAKKMKLINYVNKKRVNINIVKIKRVVDKD